MCFCKLGGMWKLLLPLLPACLSLADMPTTQPATAPAWKNLGVQDAEALAKRPEVIILDVRTEKEFKFVRIPRAINIDVLADGFAQKISKLQKDKTYLVYCATGRRSVTACQTMSDAGFAHINNLTGGIKAWEQAGKRTE